MKTGLDKALVAALLLIAGCSSSPTWSGMFGETRTLPEDADVTFGNRHAPALNPGGATGGTRHGPGDSSALPTGPHQPIAGNATDPAAFETASNTPAPQATRDSSATSSPAPAASTSQPAPAADNSSYPALAEVPPVPAHSSKAERDAELNAMVQQHDQAEAQRHILLSDSGATVLTSPATGQMVNAPENAAPSTSQTAAGGAPAVSTTAAPSMVKAEPAPTASASDQDGFNGWLHGMLGGESPAPQPQGPRQVPTENAQMAPAESPAPETNAPRPLMAGSAPDLATPPASTVSPQAVAEAPPASATQPLPQTAFTRDTGGKEVAPGVILMPPATPAPALADSTGFAPTGLPPSMNSGPMQPVPMQAASMPPISSSAPMETQATLAPVHLHPPMPSAANETMASASPNPAIAAPESGARVHLIPPAGRAQTRYLADSRYAERRLHNPVYDGGSD